MQLPKSEQLNIASLSRLFDNKSECYKLFWFQAILHHVCKGQQEIRFEDLIDHMIASAWYMVTEYHLNLGPRDKLEEAVNYISRRTAMLPNVKQQEILDWLRSCTDGAVIRYKRTLTLNVPYRLQAPFLTEFRGDTWNCGARELAGRINQQRSLCIIFWTKIIKNLCNYRGFEIRSIPFFVMALNNSFLNREGFRRIPFRMLIQYCF